MPRVVILGTGTAVGKTYVAAALSRALRDSTKGSVLAVKPIETGVSTGIVATDARRLERAAGAKPPAPHPLFAFREPVSPHLAARNESRAISLPKLLKWIERAEQSQQALHDTAIRWLIVETAGGAWSPLSSRLTNVDLALALEPAIWILVASDSLGVIHDVSATLRALEHAARRPDYVVLSAARKPDASTGTNANELTRLRIVRPAATLVRGRSSPAQLVGLVNALDTFAKRRGRDRARSEGAGRPTAPLHRRRD